MWIGAFWLLALGVATTASFCRPFARDRLLVRVDSGVLRGNQEGDVLSWKGIPFAAPPEGRLRWRPPEPPEPWQGLRLADEFGERCVQPAPEPLIYPPRPALPPTGVEDCLYLNVWRPAEWNEERLPVLVYVHGGAGITGSGSDWSGERIASVGHAVVVTFNHRLGPIGFLAVPELTLEDPDSPTNFGLLDQIAALEWVQENIVAFGGDPGHVTVFGHSAGGHYISALLASPRAAGLFSGAIIQSGTPIAFPLKRWEELGIEMTKRLPCDRDTDRLECLRAASSADLSVAGQATKQAVYGYTSWGAVIDGQVVPRQIIETVERGEQNRVPLIIGTASREYLAFQMRLEPFMTEQDVRGALWWLGRRVDQALSHYPIGNFKHPNDALAAMISDRDIICPSSRLAVAASESQRDPVWRYVFSHGFDLPPVSALGPHHGIDRYFLFPDPAGNRRLSAREGDLSDVMIRYWVRFAATGDPNGGDDPEWPRFEPASRRFLRLDTPISVESEDRPATCDFWEHDAP